MERLLMDYAKYSAGKKNLYINSAKKILHEKYERAFRLFFPSKASHHKKLIVSS